MSVFLRQHGDAVAESAALAAALATWQVVQQAEAARLDELVGYCSGVVAFLRNPRT